MANNEHLKIDSKDAALISHNVGEQDLNIIVTKIKKLIIQSGDKPDATVKEQLELLEQLQQFEFGRFLLVNRGINGVWTRYMVLYPERKQDSLKNKTLKSLEKWMLEKAPTMLATQERFRHFQKLLQEQLHDNIKLASVPCGMMDDLLTLNFSGLSNIKLIGIDLDPDSIEGAKETAKNYVLQTQTDLMQIDAWQLNVKNEWDVITSNGLNIYEADDEKVIELYRRFHTALKKNGVLITSFLTPPPVLSQDSPWDMTKINSEDLRRQKIIFSYILGAKWQAFRTEEQTVQQLKKAGFKKVKIVYDKAKMFPTVLATA